MQSLVPFDHNAQRFQTPRRQTRPLHWRHYLLVVVEHKWVALATFLIVMGLMIAWTYHQTPLYRATATVQVDADTMKVLNIQDVLSTDTRDEQYINTQVKILQSRTLCDQVVQNLRLDRNPAFLAYAGAQGDLAGALQQCLSVQPERGTSILDIHADHPDPQIAADLANGMAKQYIKQNLDKRMAASMDAVRWLREQADEYKVKVEKSEEVLAQYRQRTKAFSLDERQNVVVDQLKAISANVTQAKQARVVAESEWKAVKSLLDQGSNPTDISAILSNPKVGALRQQLNDKQVALAVLRERYR